MAKKKSNNEGEKNNGGKDNGGKKDNSAIVEVLNIDLQCKVRASKIIIPIRVLDGVETVSVGDKSKAVVGKVDQSKLLEMVDKKSNKKVEPVSPLLKKGNDKEKKIEENMKNKAGDGEEKKKKKKKKKKTEDKSVKEPNEKKPKEPPTVALKVSCLCEGCIQKIRKVVSKTEGCLDMKIEREKDLVKVKGTMDAKVLAETLKKNLKKSIEIVQLKEKGGGDKGKGGSKGGGGGDGGSKADGDGGSKATGGGRGAGGGYMVEVVHRMVQENFLIKYV